MATPAADVDGPQLQLNSQSLDYVEQLYSEYKDNPDPAPADWRALFGMLANGTAPAAGSPKLTAPVFDPRLISDAKLADPKLTAATPPETKLVLESHRLAAHVPPVAPIHPAYPVNGNGSGKHEELAARQERVDQLIRNDRGRGHIISDIDPLDQFRPPPADLVQGFL